MEKLNSMTLAIMLTVGVILTASLLVPVINDATETNKTFTNDGLWRMAENQNGMIYTHDAGVPEWNLNDEIVLSGSIISNNPNSNVILGDNWLVRANGWIRGDNLGGNNTSSVTVNVDTDTILLAGAGLAGTTTQPLSGFGFNKEGDYLMSAYNSPVYMLGDSPIYATGLTSFSNNGVYTIIHIEGTINDGVSITLIGARNNTVTDLTISNVVVDSERVTGYENLYKLHGITADVTFIGKNGSADPITIEDSISYSSYVVPYQVTADRTVQLDTASVSLLNALPLMVIVGLIIVAAGSIYFKRND